MAHNLSPATRKASTRSSSAAGTTRPANASSSRQRDVRTISPTPSYTFGYNITYAIFYLGYSLLSWPISWTKFSKVSLPNAAIMHSNWLKVGSHVTWNIKSECFFQNSVNNNFLWRRQLVIYSSIQTLIRDLWNLSASKDHLQLINTTTSATA